MNKNSLHKIISTFIVPRYPWIDSFGMQVYLDAPIERYMVYYYVKPEDDGTITVTEEMGEVEELTETLFKMLGPEKYQSLIEVNFLIKNKD